MKLMAPLEGAIELLRKLLESECHTFFSSGFDFRGRD
jgi:hypothetical protein